MATEPERIGSFVDPVICKEACTCPAIGTGSFTLRVSWAFAKLTAFTRAANLKPALESMIPVATKGILP